MNLCQIKPGQAIVIRQLMKRIYPPVYQHLWEDDGQWYLDNIYSENQIEKELLEQDTSWWEVLFEEKCIGMLRVKLNKSLPDAPTKNGLQLHKIYLDPAIHSKGIGQSLMSFVEQTALQLEKQLIWLEVMDSQQSAIRFYEKAGFTKCGNFKLPYQGIHPDLRGMFRMVKYI